MNIPRFTAAASHYRSRGHYPSGGTFSDGARGVSPALVGRWSIPWTRCEVNCIEVCTRFCAPTGWDCCGWETRCALSCDGQVIATTY
jgi:hypothetical protein